MNNRDRYNFSPDSLERARHVIRILEADFGLAAGDAGRRLVVAIAGESGSGKSVAASSLAHELEAAGYRPQVLYQDDYFVRPPRTNHEFRMVDIAANVGPHEVQLDLIAAHIAAFRAARDETGPLVDYPGNRFLVQSLPFSSCNILVVEGTYVLGLHDLDVRIFCSATHVQTRERRRARNRDIDDPMVDRVLALEHALIAPTGATADLVIDADLQLERRR